MGVQDNSHTAEARRIAIDFATKLHFSETETGNIALVVTEAARNLLKHAGGGDLILRTAESHGTPMLEMLAIDSGPGISDVGRSFQDGYSTTGTPGTGLGAIARLASLHDIYSRPDQGTALLVQMCHRQVRSSAPPVSPPSFQIGAVSIAKSGETACGDAWGFRPLSSGGRFILADGLGHGPLAEDASAAAVRVALETSEGGIGLMERIHAALRPTRGAAVAIAEIDTARGLVLYTGIGNIVGSLISHSGTVQHMISHPGTAGHQLHKVSEFSYPWTPGALLLMHSDGLGTHWSFDRYPGLTARHASVIAGVLYRDFTRKRDDATVIVARQEAVAA